MRRNVVSQNGGSTARGRPLHRHVSPGRHPRREEHHHRRDRARGRRRHVQAGISCTAGNFLIGNTVTNAPIGINGGKYQNNLFINCATPFTGGFNAGGNN